MSFNYSYEGYLFYVANTYDVDINDCKPNLILQNLQISANTIASKIYLMDFSRCSQTNESVEELLEEATYILCYNAMHSVNSQSSGNIDPFAFENVAYEFLTNNGVIEF